MKAGREHERGELLQEIRWSEDDVGRAVAPAVLPTVEQAAVLEA
jgi:hypothetical protein